MLQGYIVTFFIFYLMSMKFFKDSVRELKHVVWPTREETRKYLLIVVTVLTIFGIYLFIFNYAFSEALFFFKDLFKN